MELQHWNLSILAKAVHYKNLSAAAQHVGVSQPQLSRIIARLEADLGIILLDRTARRKSGWTKQALEVAEIYMASARKLNSSLQVLNSDEQMTHVTIACLEGMIDLAARFAHEVYNKTKVNLVELLIEDLSLLEEHFAKNEYDLIFTSREPSSRKYRYSKILGYQNLEKLERGDSPRVMSPFQFSRTTMQKRMDRGDRVLLSNSLAARKRWVELYGGTGVFPSEVRKKKTGKENEVPVYLIGSETLNSTFWKKIDSFDL